MARKKWLHYPQRIEGTKEELFFFIIDYFYMQCSVKDRLDITLYTCVARVDFIMQRSIEFEFLLERVVIKAIISIFTCGQ